jgi:hypothetical protein
MASEWRRKTWAVTDGVKVFAENKTYRQAWKIAEKAAIHSGVTVVPNDVAKRVKHQERVNAMVGLAMSKSKLRTIVNITGLTD